MPTVNFYCVLCGSALQVSSEKEETHLPCPSCAQHVPVPKHAHHREDVSASPLVFPPSVLELLVKFQCTSCAAELYADARSEGRDVVCSSCKKRTGIPRWSHALGRARFSEDAGHARSRTPLRAEAPTLSLEEIDFLRGSESRNPGAAA